MTPLITGIGPAPAVRNVLALTGLSLAQIDVIELSEDSATRAQWSLRTSLVTLKWVAALGVTPAA